MNRTSAICAVALLLVSCSSNGGGSEAEPLSSASVGAVESDNTTASSVPIDGDVIALATQSGNGDPNGVQLPAAPDNSARDWLSGDGASAADLATVTAPLWLVGSAACADVAAELDLLGSPEAVLAAAAETPDPVTRDLLVGLHAATGRALGACLDEADFATALHDFAWQWALADRRLEELGVTR